MTTNPPSEAERKKRNQEFVEYHAGLAAATDARGGKPLQYLADLDGYIHRLLTTIGKLRNEMRELKAKHQKAVELLQEAGCADGDDH